MKYLLCAAALALLSACATEPQTATADTQNGAAKCRGEAPIGSNVPRRC